MPDHHTSRGLPYFFPRFPVDVDHNMTSLKAAELWCWRPFHVGLGGGKACSVVIEHIKHIPEPSMPLYTANLMDYHVYINIHNVYIYIYSHNIHVCIIYIYVHTIFAYYVYIYISIYQSFLYFDIWGQPVAGRPLCAAESGGPGHADAAATPAYGGAIRRANMAMGRSLIHLLKCGKTYGFHRKMINKWWVFHTIDGLSHYL